MSLDLCIEKIKPIPVTELLFAIQQELCELLHQTDIPELIIEEFEDGEYRPVTRALIGLKDDMFAVSMKAREEKAFLIILPDGFTSCEVCYTRSPLEFALVAALAIVVARKSQANITDEALAWNTTYEQSSKSFATKLKASGQFVTALSSSAH